MDVKKAEIQKHLTNALADDTAHAERIAFCKAVCAALTESAQRLYIGGWVLRNRKAEAIGVLTEMAAELSEGAVALLERDLYYAAASVVRQLVEVQYFYFCFVTDATASETWLAATSEEIRQQFNPSAMRKRSAGRFRDEEYWIHCDHGGHPNPKARLLLKNHSTPLGDHRFMWADLAQHLREIWSLLLEALATAQCTDHLSAEVQRDTQQALNRWEEFDLASTRIQIPTNA